MQSVQLTRAVQRVLRETPLSLRAIARAAGVSHTLLQMVLVGTRSATPELAAKLIGFLEQMAAESALSARRIRVAMEPRSRISSSPRGKQPTVSESA